MVRHRLLSRSLMAAAAFGFLHVTFVGCGSSDGSKAPRSNQDGGEGGEPAAAGSSAQPNPPGGSSSGEGAGGAEAIGGAAGTATTGGSAAAGADSGGAAGADGSSGGEAGAVAASGATTGGAGADGGAAGLASGGDGGAGNDCITSGSRIAMAFDTANPERVTSLTWLDSAGMTTANLAVSGGSGACGDPTEFFGQSYGVAENTTPYVIFAGTRSTLTRCGLDAQLTASATNCTGAAQIPATTEYHFYAGEKASQVRVTRRVTFDETSPDVTGVALRTWQPRVSRTTFPNTIYPNSAGTAVTTTPAANCPNDCLFDAGNDWNKQWFAMTGPSGLAVIVRRDPALTTPINMVINWDGFSLSNLSSFVWPKPEAGFKAPLEEVEYLCLADLTSWPQTERDAAQLPAFCGP